MRFKILGPVAVLNEQRICVPPLPKARQVFALLLSRYNYTVGTESFIDELWDDYPPRSAMTTLQTYVYHLRKWLNRERVTVAPKCLLITRPRGYALAGTDDQLDARVFERLLAEGRALLTEGKSLECSRKLRGALSLWQGDPLSNVTHGRLLEAHVVHLE
ncbi:MAG: AfsR/SARP family transcriptional regulator, partial [Candidatus Binatia bacterium]